jgi:hypothetical protein
MTEALIVTLSMHGILQITIIIGEDTENSVLLRDFRGERIGYSVKKMINFLILLMQKITVQII